MLLLSLVLSLQPAETVAQENSGLQAQSHRSKQAVDLIIKGDHIVSMDADGSVYKDAAVAVDPDQHEAPLRACVPSCTMRSYFLAAATIVWPSMMLWPSGFST